MINLCTEYSSDFYKNLLENIDIGVYFVDRNRVITFLNKAAEKITGYTAEEVVGRSCKSNLFKHIDQYGNELCIIGCPLHATIGDGMQREAEVYLRHKDGHRIPVRVTTSKITDANGNIIGAVETFQDTSIEHRIEKEKEDLKALAMIDELTNLPNRRYIEEWLIAKHREFKKFDRCYGVLIIDVDNFKKINDSYGHLVGDEMLKVVSKTLSSAARANDLIGRFGGEEFIFVLSGIDSKKLHSIGERICSLVANSSLEVGNIDLAVSVSVGGAVASHYDTIRSLLETADHYMYKAKSTGKNRVCTSCGTDIAGVELNN